jgi:hypothetical protein
MIIKVDAVAASRTRHDATKGAQVGAGRCGRKVSVLVQQAGWNVRVDKNLARAGTVTVTNQVSLVAAPILLVVEKSLAGVSKMSFYRHERASWHLG